MPSNKKRRTIGIHIELFEIIKDEAASLEPKVSPTRLVTMILKGKSAPVSGDYTPSKNKSVSMPEYLWHALKARAKENDAPAQQVGRQILVGSEPPLTSDEIQLGLGLVAKREATESEIVQIVPVKSTVTTHSLDTIIDNLQSTKERLVNELKDKERKVLGSRFGLGPDAVPESRITLSKLSKFETEALLKRFGLSHVLGMVTVSGPDPEAVNDSRFNETLDQWARLATPLGAKLTTLEKELLSKRFGIRLRCDTPREGAPTASEEDMASIESHRRTLSSGASAEASDVSGKIEPDQEFYGGVFSI